MAAMAAAKSLGANRGVVISYANSGDTSIGESSRVVGYGAVVLTAEGGGKDTSALAQTKPAAVSAPLSASEKKALLAFARETISRLLLTDTVPLARGFSENLRQPRGAFVTLKKKGELRGCIGRMIPDEPLCKIVGAMAIQAAFNDPRFHPLTADELNAAVSRVVDEVPVARQGSRGGVDDRHYDNSKSALSSSEPVRT